MTRLPRCSTNKEQIIGSTQKYRSNHRYNIHKKINTITNLEMTQWWNNRCTGDLQKKCQDEV